MRRPGSDEQNLTMADFWCDFCHREWTEQRPMVEGHEGSLVCGECLSAAYRACLVEKRSATPAEQAETGAACIMCLEDRKDRTWMSAAYPKAIICERCIRQAATALEHDGESGWKKPDSEGMRQ